MKNRKNIAGFVIGLFAFLALLPSVSTAQNGGCSLIGNDINCTVKFQVDVYQLTAGVCPATPCLSYQAGLTPFTSMNVNCAPCNQVCKVEITILSVNGIPATGGTDSNTFGPQTITTVPCAGSTIEYSNYSVGGVFKIKP